MKNETTFFRGSVAKNFLIDKIETWLNRLCTWNWKKNKQTWQWSFQTLQWSFRGFIFPIWWNGNYVFFFLQPSSSLSHPERVDLLGRPIIQTTQSGARMYMPFWVHTDNKFSSWVPSLEPLNICFLEFYSSDQTFSCFSSTIYRVTI